MSTHKTEQEKFWAGSFGDEYISRNNSDALLMSKVSLWSQMLRSANGISSVLELGCNIGFNLVALQRLRPSTKVTGVEINATAAKQAQKNAGSEIIVGSILDDLECEVADLTFTMGVLIHIKPGCLDAVYRNLFDKSRRYVLVAEYYNPSPVAIPYRGHADRLFKRDFAGEIMDQFGMKLVDYGFTYKRDNWAPQDDVTWFLLEK